MEKSKKISGWFISWEGVGNHVKMPPDEIARIILINQNGRPDRPEPIADFMEMYYISTLHLDDKISWRSPRLRKTFPYRSKITSNKAKNGYIISCGHNPYIFAEYRRDVAIPIRDYPAWFPNKTSTID